MAWQFQFNSGICSKSHTRAIPQQPTKGWALPHTRLNASKCVKKTFVDGCVGLHCTARRSSTPLQPPSCVDDRQKLHLSSFICAVISHTVFTTSVACLAGTGDRCGGRSLEWEKGWEGGEGSTTTNDVPALMCLVIFPTASRGESTMNRFWSKSKCVVSMYVCNTNWKCYVSVQCSQSNP